MNVLFVHQEVSGYCTAQLCPTSNRRLYLNALSNLSVCKERPAENRKEPNVWPAWNLTAAACIACTLIVTISVVAWRQCRKVSYIIDDTNRHQMFEGMPNETLSYEQLESVELTDENEPIIASSNFK
ncbi:hypothetical protein GE061_002148 [Apolygus lucorum]|uniref:Uncharacterized protein n=1 Tax=Apolygus lucorum TaxID=248454 RepID=A0A6A4J2K3_APOLU|nr:hypothetical protein GE061_002148 [Apolygus lucorum]